MGSVAGGLLGGKPKSSSSTTTVQVPSWLDTQNQRLVNRAVTASNTPYVAYTGQRVADLSADTLRGQQLARDLVGRYTPLMNRSSELANLFGQRAQTGPSATDIQSRMNPYIQNVLDITRRKIGEQSGDQLANLRSQAALSNVFGGSRNAIKESQLYKNTAQLMSDAEAEGMANAYQNALGLWNQQNQDILGASQNLGRVAASGQELDTNDFSNLLKTGEITRLLEQQKLDTKYEDFDKERAYPYEQLNFLSNILNPMTSYYAGGTTTGQQRNGGGSTLGNIIGMGANIASIVSAIPWSDRRLKENIKKVGKLDNGLPVFRYNFKGDPKTQIGVMAQDVEKVNPKAVAELGGAKMVDYKEATRKFMGGGEVTREGKAKELKQAPSKGSSLPGAPNFGSDGGGDEGGMGGMGGLGNLLTNIFGGPKSTTLGSGEIINWDTDRFGGKWMFAQGGPIKKGKKSLAQETLGNLYDQVAPLEMDDNGELLSAAADNVPVGDAPMRPSMTDLEAYYATQPSPTFDQIKALEEQMKKEPSFLDTIMNPKIPAGAMQPGKLNALVRMALTTPGEVFQGFVAAPNKDLPKPMQENAAKFAAAKAQLGQQAQEDEFVNLINQYTAPEAPSAAPQYAASAQTAPQTSDDILDLLKRRLVAQETPPSTLGLSEALAVFGRGMLDTEGEERDFFQQIGMGSKAVEKAQKERSDSAQEQMAKQMEQLADFLKTKAYIEQVEKQGQITPYQERTLDIEEKNSAISLLRAIAAIKNGTGTADDMAAVIRAFEQ